MIRVVLDTNVVVSALISPFGNEALVIAAAQDGRIAPCISRETLAEYAEVLARPKFGFAENEIEGLIGLLQSRGIPLEPKPVTGASPDPSDDIFVACALAAEAEFLVTGNKRHFPDESYGRAKVVSARELLEAINTPRFW
jgi:putative PIN family toxin of toxin-antitoxin system